MTTSSALEERLSALLASPNFSVPAYLNLALRSSANHEEQMASLALQLQIKTQSCHDEIGRIGAELQAIVPRCAADVGRLKGGLEGMELDVAGLLAGMDDDDDDDDNNNNNHHPLHTLHSLLNLRTHLTAARSILAAAASWDETVHSIPALLSAAPPKLTEAVYALSQLEAGARALRGMPGGGREERNASLAKLRSQLETLLKPQLLHALRKMDTRLGPLQLCVGMYGSLGKMEVLREEYVRCRPGEIIALWFSFGGGGGSAKMKSDERQLHDEDGTGEEDETKDFDFSEDADDSAPQSTQSTTTNVTTTTTTTTTTATNAKQFIEFLPMFYEAVLELLSKERNQSRLVFGAKLSPSIVAQVLMECFKPIVNSFEKRLGSLCPAPGKGYSSAVGGGAGSRGGSGVGGMEAIAAAYESTIQFLSLAYDQMEAWDGSKDSADAKGVDSSSSDPTSDKSNQALQTIRQAFILIASPFLPYQRALAEAERDPMGEAASMVAKDVRSVVSFEDAAERLGGLAPFMFPLAEGESFLLIDARELKGVLSWPLTRVG